MAGRTAKATPEVVAEVEQALARGATIAQAAGAVRVSPRTLKRWLHDGVVHRRRLRPVPDPEEPSPDEGRFTDERIEEAMVAAIMKAAPVDWRAARFILQSRWPDKWGKPSSS